MILFLKFTPLFNPRPTSIPKWHLQPLLRGESNRSSNKFMAFWFAIFSGLYAMTSAVLVQQLCDRNVVAVGTAAWAENLMRNLCALTAWHDSGSGLATTGMEHLSALARLDTPYSAEVAAVAAGLLAAAQLRRRLELQQQEQTTNASFGPVRRGPERCLLGWKEGAFRTFWLAFGGAILIRIGWLWESSLLPPVGRGGNHGAPLSDRLLLVALVAAACYAAMGFSWCRRLLDHRLVRTSLGIVAELLRAGHVSAAAATALALLPPLLSVRGEQGELRPAVGAASPSTDSPVLRENTVFVCVIVGLLRLIASVLAGAAVSCFGEGGWARHVLLTPDSKSRRLWPNRSSVNLRGATASLGGERRVSNVRRRGGDEGDGGGGDEQKRRRDREGMGAELVLASPSWFVPSGALGGAFYAVSVKSVCGALSREFVFGNDWFASPESVRLTLALVYAGVFLLRSISEISEIPGSTFNPLRPFYRLLGLENLPRSSNGVAISLRKRLRLDVGAAHPHAGPTAPVHTSDAVFRGRSAGSEVSRALLSSTEGIDDDLDDDYICERCRASGAIRTGGGLQQQKQRQPKGEGSAEGCETVSSNANATVSSAADQLLRETRRSGGVRRLRDSSTDDEGPRDAAASQAKKTAIAPPEELPFESKDGIKIDIPAGVAGYDATLEPFSEAQKKDQVCRRQSEDTTGSGDNGSRGSNRSINISISGCSIVGDDVGLTGAASSAAVALTSAPYGSSGSSSGMINMLDSAVRPGVEIVGRTKKQDAPAADAAAPASSRPSVDAADTWGLSVVGDVYATSNNDATDGGLVSRCRGSSYPRDGCGHERECGEIVKRNIGKTKMNNSSEGDDEENLEERKRETDGSRGRVQEPPPPPPLPPLAPSLALQDTEAIVEGARFGIGCGSGCWFWLELLETWALFLVLVVFFVRQLAFERNRRFWRDKAPEAWVSSGMKAFFDGAESVLLLRFPLGKKVGIVLTALMRAARVRSVAEKMTPRVTLPCIPYGAALTCLGAFGGDLLASACLGNRSMVLTEELAFPSAVVAWMIVRGRLWGTPESYPFSLRGILSWAGIHHAIVLLAEIFRALLVCRAVESAKGLAGAGESCSWALAVIAGVLAGCGGLFLPCDCGLSPLSEGVPWALQSAVYGAAFYYCLASTTKPARAHAQAVVALCFSSVALARTSHRWGPTFNPFSPIHRATSRLLGLSTREAFRSASTGASEAAKAPTKPEFMRPSLVRCRSCSPIGERREAAAAIASSAARPSRGHRRSASLDARNGGSTSTTGGVHTEAGATAAASERALPFEDRWGFRERSSSRRRFPVRGFRQLSPPPLALAATAAPDGGEGAGLALGGSRSRNALSICSDPQSDVYHRRDVRGDISASVAGDQKQENYCHDRGGGENTLSGSSIPRGVGRVGVQGETDAACERGTGRLVDGDALGATGVGRGMTWAAFAVSAIVVGRWLAFPAHPGGTFPGTSTDNLQPRSSPRVEHPLDATAGGVATTLGRDSDAVIGHRGSQAYPSASFGRQSFGDDAEGVGSQCKEGGGDQRCLHQGSSDGTADQEEEGMGRGSLQSPPPVLLLSSLSSAIKDFSEAVGEFSEISKEWVDEVSGGENFAASDVLVDSNGHETDTLIALSTSPPAQTTETLLSRRSLVSSTLDAGDAAVGRDEMDRAVASTVKTRASFFLNQDQPPPPAAGAIPAFSIAEENGVDDAVSPKKMAPNVCDSLSPMNSPDASFVAAGSSVVVGSVGGSRCPDSEGMKEGALAAASTGVADDAANVVGCSSGLDGSSVALGSNGDENLGLVTSCVGGLGVEISDASLRHRSGGSAAIGVESEDAADLCASSSSSCSTCVAVDADTFEVAGCVSVGDGATAITTLTTSDNGACVDSEDLPTMGVPSCCDHVDARAEFDAADEESGKVVRDATAGSDVTKADASFSKDSFDVVKDVGTAGDPIRKDLALDRDHVETVDAVRDGFDAGEGTEAMTVGSPSSSIGEGGLVIDHLKTPEVVTDGARTAVASAADCDTDHVVAVDGKCVVDRVSVQAGNAADVDFSVSSISGRGNSGDGVSERSHDGSEGEPVKVGSVRNAVGDDADSGGNDGGSPDGSERDPVKARKFPDAIESISRDTVGGDAVSSLSRVCETSVCAEREPQSVETATEAIPSSFSGVKPLSPIAPKTRPWGLPNHAPVPSPSGDPSIASVFKYVSPSDGDFLRDGYVSEAPASPIGSAATVGVVGSRSPSWVMRRSDKSYSPEIGSVGAEHDTEAEAKGPLRDTEQSALTMGEMTGIEKGERSSGADAVVVAAVMVEDEEYPDETAEKQHNDGVDDDGRIAAKTVGNGLPSTVQFTEAEGDDAACGKGLMNTDRVVNPSFEDDASCVMEVEDEHVDDDATAVFGVRSSVESVRNYALAMNEHNMNAEGVMGSSRESAFWTSGADEDLDNSNNSSGVDGENPDELVIGKDHRSGPKIGAVGTGSDGAVDSSTEGGIPTEKMTQKQQQELSQQDTEGDDHGGLSGSVSSILQRASSGPNQGVAAHHNEDILAEFEVDKWSNLPAELLDEQEAELFSAETGGAGEVEASDAMSSPVSFPGASASAGIESVTIGSERLTTTSDRATGPYELRGGTVTETADSTLGKGARSSWPKPCEPGLPSSSPGSYSSPAVAGDTLLCRGGVDCDVSVLEGVPKGDSNLEAGDDFWVDSGGLGGGTGILVDDPAADGSSDGIGDVDCSQCGAVAEIDGVTYKVSTAGVGKGEGGEGSSCVAAAPPDWWAGPLDRQRKSSIPQVPFGNRDSSTDLPRPAAKSNGEDAIRKEDGTLLVEGGTDSSTAKTTDPQVRAALLPSGVGGSATARPSGAREDIGVTSVSSWSGGGIAVDEEDAVAVEARAKSTLEDARELSSAGLEIDGVDDDYDPLLPEEVSPVLDGVSVFSEDRHKSAPEIVGRTLLPPLPTEDNKKAAGTAVRKAVAVIAVAAYYGVWAAITLVLG